MNSGRRPYTVFENALADEDGDDDDDDEDRRDGGGVGVHRCLPA